MSGYTGDSTFSGVSFLVEESGPLARAAFGRRSARSIRKAPYGTRTIMQVLGNEPAELTLTLTLLAAQYSALLGKVGTTGTLTIAGDTARTGVYLDRLEDVTADDANGLTFCRATFIQAG